jgi:hypothetical protein
MAEKAAKGSQKDDDGFAVVYAGAGEVYSQLGMPVVQKKGYDEWVDEMKQRQYECMYYSTAKKKKEEEGMSLERTIFDAATAAVYAAVEVKRWAVMAIATAHARSAAIEAEEAAAKAREMWKWSKKVHVFVNGKLGPAEEMHDNDESDECSDHSDDDSSGSEEEGSGAADGEGAAAAAAAANTGAAAAAEGDAATEGDAAGVLPSLAGLPASVAMEKGLLTMSGEVMGGSNDDKDGFAGDDEEGGKKEGGDEDAFAAFAASSPDDPFDTRTDEEKAEEEAERLAAIEKAKVAAEERAKREAEEQAKKDAEKKARKEEEKKKRRKAKRAAAAEAAAKEVVPPDSPWAAHPFEEQHIADGKLQTVVVRWESVPLSKSCTGELTAQSAV